MKKWYAGLFFATIGIFLLYFYAYLDLRSNYCLNGDQVSYLYDIITNRKVLQGNGSSSFEVPFTNTFDTLILSYITMLFPTYISACIFTLFYLLFGAYAIYSKNDIIFLFFASLFLLSGQKIFLLSTEYISEFKNGLLLMTLAVLITGDKKSKKIDILICLTTFLLIGLRTINLVFLSGFLVYGILINMLKYFEHQKIHWRPIIWGICLSLPILFFTIPPQIKYIWINSTQNAEIWQSRINVNSKIELILYILQMTNKYIPLIVLITIAFLFLSLSIRFIYPKKEQKKKLIYTQFIRLMHFISFAFIVFFALSSAATSNSKIVFWIYAISIPILVEVIFLFKINKYKISILFSVGFVCLYLFSVNKEYTHYKKILPRTFTELTNIQKSIIEQSNKKSLKDPIIYNNFHGIRPLDSRGIYVASEGEVRPQFSFNPYKDKSYDEIMIKRAMRKSDFIIILNDKNFAPSLPYNSWIEQKANFVSENYRQHGLSKLPEINIYPSRKTHFTIYSR